MAKDKETEQEVTEKTFATSKPNEWIARRGSDAEGRMDMLTAL